MVLEFCVDPDTSHEEGIGVAEVDGEEHGAEAKTLLHATFHGDPGVIVDVFLEVVQLRLLHSEGDDDTDRVKGLVGQPSAPRVSTSRGVILGDASFDHDHDADYNDGAEDEHNEGQAPALEEAEAES